MGTANFFTFILILNFLIILPLQAAGKQNKVCFKEHCFTAELAKTTQEHAQGLMFRKQMDAGEGMLFIFPSEGAHPFWMKNTYIPLDIIWLDRNKEVVFIKEKAQPCREEKCPLIEPDRLASYVLEINAGWVEAMRIKIGDCLNFFLE